MEDLGIREFILKHVKNNPNKSKSNLVRLFLKAILWPISISPLIRILENWLFISISAKYAREVWLPVQNPHYSDSRALFYIGYRNRFPFLLNRGFYSKQVIPPGGTVLDIGCGDGFYDYFFFSRIAKKIDALDFEKDAIKNAKKFHSSPNVKYHTLNFITDDLPNEKYDVVIMDGSIGHFEEKDMDTLMNKILDCMKDDSFFVGSEAMQTKETKSYDHYQIFPTTKHMENFLSKYFKLVNVWSEDEEIYKQVYFRCAKTIHAFEKLENNSENNVRKLIS